MDTATAAEYRVGIMRVYCCQFDMAWEDKAANHQRVAAMLESASIEADSLIVLPEMFATGYSLNTTATIEPQDGPTHQFMSQLAQRHRSWLLGGAVMSRDGVHGRNDAVVYSPDGAEISRYTKMFTTTPLGESDVHERGEQVVTFRIHDWRVAPFICYDLRFPEIFREATARGAELLIVIASWPAVRAAHWVSLLIARAIENQAYVIGVNRIGSDPNHPYPGRSMIIHPRGQVLADAGDAETVITAELNLDELRAYRAQLPFLADMRERRDAPVGG